MTVEGIRLRAKRFAIALCILCALCAPRALALEPDQIALIVNKNVPEGRKLAVFYSQQRHIPEGRIIEVDLPAPDPANFPELITPVMYDSRVVSVVRESLAKGGLDHKVTCLVTFWGMPLRILPREVPDLAKAERTALEAQLKDELSPKLQREVSAMEGLARELNPKFQAGNGNEVPQLSARLSAAMNAAFAQIASMDPSPRREAAFDQLLGITERMFGSDTATAKLAEPPVAKLAARPPSPAEAAAAGERLAATHQRIAQLSGDLSDAKAREEVRSLARQRLGLMGYALQLRAQADSLNTDNSDAALDSELALLWWPSYPKARWLNNPLWWRMGNAPGTQRTLMVIRLDAPTPQIVRDMITTSIQVEATGLKGQAALDALGKPPTHPYAAYDRTITNLAKLLTTQTKMPVTYDDKEAVFAAHSLKDIAIYCGWYSLRNYVPPGQFNPGAVGFHVASFELISLHDRNEKGWVRGLLNDGIAATLGPVAEPYLQSFPPADEFFPLLLTGQLTLAEVYWRTTPMVSWMQTCIGDPLYRPFLKNPQVEASILPPTLIAPVN